MSAPSFKFTGDTSTGIYYTGERLKLAVMGRSFPLPAFLIRWLGFDRSAQEAARRV
jgi:hypothetical protein